MKQSITFYNFSAGKLGWYTLFLILLIPSFSQAEVVDRVVAIVNNDIITLSELEEEAAGLYTLIARKSGGAPMLDELAKAREITLDNLIDQTLIDQMARQQNINVTSQDIDRAFETMRSNVHLDQEAFIKKLEDSGMTERMYRSKLKTQILQSKLVSRDVRSRIVITEEMILDYYDTHYTSRVEKGSYYLLQMGFTWDHQIDDSEQLQKSRETAKRRANRVYKLTKGGKDFKTLAKKFSDLPSAADGGDIGIFTLDDMAPVMRDAIAPLASGELSQIVEFSSGFQFFKVLSGEEDSIVVTASLEAVRAEIKEKLYQEKLKEEFSQWVEKLRENAYIQKL